MAILAKIRSAPDISRLRDAVAEAIETLSIEKTLLERIEALEVKTA